MPPESRTAVVPFNDEMNDRYGERSGQYNLRTRKTPNYDIASLLVQVDPHVVAPSFNANQVYGINTSLTPLLNVMLTQYGVKKVLRMFGENVDLVERSEMQQLHDFDVMRPKPP